MSETLLTPSSIKLFGRVLNSLTYTNDTYPFGYNNFLQRQLAGGLSIQTTGNILNNVVPQTGDANQNDPYTVTGVAATTGFVPGMTITGWTQPIVGPPPIPALQAFVLGTSIVPPITNNSFKISRLPSVIANNVTLTAALSPVFARIYAFSFEGSYCALPRPSIFLVHGYGQWAGDWNINSSLDQSGVVGKDWDFSGSANTGGPDDIYYWEYEKGDFSMRVDLDAGPFEQILLQMALRGGADMADRSGQGLGIRSGQGLDARSGQGLDIRSGQGLRR